MIHDDKGSATPKLVAAVRAAAALYGSALLSEKLGRAADILEASLSTTQPNPAPQEAKAGVVQETSEAPAAAGSTLRTEAALFFYGDAQTGVVPANVARQLERELADARDGEGIAWLSQVEWQRRAEKAERESAEAVRDRDACAEDARMKDDRIARLVSAASAIEPNADAARFDWLIHNLDEHSLFQVLLGAADLDGVFTFEAIRRHIDAAMRRSDGGGQS